MLEHIWALIPAIKDAVGKQLANNQFFAGMVGTGLVGGIAFFLRSLPKRLYQFAYKRLTSTISIRSDLSNDYWQIVAFLSKHRVEWLGRTFMMTDVGLVPAYGTSYSIWNGKWLKVNRSSTNLDSRIVDEITIVMRTRSKTLLTRLIEDASAKEPDNQLVMKTTSGGSWTFSKIRKRHVDTVFANAETLRSIMEALVRFREREDWYAARGIPYKFVCVLEGPPGTGKSSIIHAIASHFEMQLYYFTSLAAMDKLPTIDNAMAIIEDIDTMSGLTRESPDRMVIIEDIDTMSDLTRESPDRNDLGSSDDDRPTDMSLSTHSTRRPGFEFHQLLNTLDGLATPHGLVVFITTNKIGDLDPALLRPGRVDKLVHIGPLGLDAMKRMFAAFYDEGGEAAIEAWAQVHGCSYRPMTGAQLQTIFMTKTMPEALETLAKSKRIHIVEAVDDRDSRAVAG